MESLLVIPARGGSKGIPGKNLREVGGQSLLARAVHSALNAHTVSRVVVSTDNEAIAAEATLAGAGTIQRPPELSGDAASSEAALLHALETLEAEENYRPDVLVFTQCTSPLTLPEDIDGTLEAMLAGDADCALSVTLFHYFVWRHTADGEAIGVNHRKESRPLRQDREPEFLETGAVYAMKAEGFRAARHRFFGRTALYEMPASRVFEVDEPADLERARLLLETRNI